MSGDSRELLREEAHIWKIRMDGGLKTAECAEFEEWMAADPLHREFYAEAEMFASAYTIMPDLDRARDPYPPEVRIAEPAVVDAEVGRFTASSRGPVLAGLLSVAFAVVMIAITLSQWGPWAEANPNSAVYDTPRAVTQIIDLPDGSRLTLAPETRLELAFSESQRRVRLVQGEVFSAVAVNLERPFVVETDRGIAQVTGTQFEMVARGNDYSVTVAEGSVQAKTLEGSLSVELKPGERVRLLSDSELGAKEEVFPEEMASWRFGRLSFVRAELSELVASFNRYSDRPITVEPSVADEIVTGTFNTGDIPAALETLQEILPITVRAEGEATVIGPQ